MAHVQLGIPAKTPPTSVYIGCFPSIDLIDTRVFHLHQPSDIYYAYVAYLYLLMPILFILSCLRCVSCLSCLCCVSCLHCVSCLSRGRRRSDIEGQRHGLVSRSNRMTIGSTYSSVGTSPPCLFGSILTMLSCPSKRIFRVDSATFRRSSTGRIHASIWI